MPAWYEDDDNTQQLGGNSKNRIAFGSCNDQDLQNNLWPIIASRQPAAFVWGGDSIYADFLLERDWSTFPPKQHLECATPQRLRKLYREQKKVPGYRQLLEQNITIFGTFDDHDYGCNNADRTYPYRYESGIAFVDFLGLSPESAMRQRALQGKGVFGVKLFDFSRPNDDYEVPEALADIDPDIASLHMPPPVLSNQTVAIFVLDVRTNKTPWKKGVAAYQPDYEGDFLGEDQWQWFEKAIARSRAAVNVVVSGLQVHAHLFSDGNVAEGWHHVPRAQQRLFNALLQEGVEAPLLISGDVHMTQLMRKDCTRVDNKEARRSLVELTTSGMTHSWGTISNPPRNSPNRPPSWTEYLESLLARHMMRILHYFSPWTSLMQSNPSFPESGGAEGAKEGLQFSLLKNFGEMEFDWERRTVVVRSLGENGMPLLAAEFEMDKLSGKTPLPGSQLSKLDFEKEIRARPLVDQSDWICANYRGRDSHVANMLGHASALVVYASLITIPLWVPGLVYLFLFRRRKQGRWTKTAKQVF